MCIRDRGLTISYKDNMSMTKKAVTMLAVFLTAFALIAAAVPLVMAQAANPTVLFTGRKNLSGAFVISDSSVAVSYTHLDVYKRQPPLRRRSAAVWGSRLWRASWTA